MAINIEGSREGGGITTLNFSDKQRARVDSLTNLMGHYVSKDDGLAFNIISHDASAAAGTFILYFKNTSPTRDFFIDLIRVGGVETALWRVWSVTGTAAGGNALTPTNLNLKSGISAEATARGDDAITGLTTVAEIATVRTAATNNTNIPFDDVLILGTNDAIAVEYDTGTTGIAEVLMRGFYLTRV